MKKTAFFAITLFVLIISSVIYATNINTGNGGYTFDVIYEGEIKKNEPKNGSVTLSGENATPYTNVRIKVDLISGPATPTILATDSSGISYNIAEIGYWGPESGFAVGGTFVNETPITATFPEAGTYVSRLSLIDLNNSDAVITSKEFTVIVTEEQVVEINNVINNVIEEIPETGTSIWTYLIFATILVLIILCGRKIINKNK